MNPPSTGTKTMSSEQAREIDVAVAEKVMGWKQHCHMADCWMRPMYTGELPSHQNYIQKHYFCPSTDPAADYSVLQRVRETFTPEQRRAFRTFLIHTWSGRLPRIPQTTGQTVPTYDIGDFEDQYLVGDYSKAALSALGDKEGV